MKREIKQILEQNLYIYTEGVIDENALLEIKGLDEAVEELDKLLNVNINEFEIKFTVPDIHHPNEVGVREWMQNWVNLVNQQKENSND